MLQLTEHFKLPFLLFLVLTFDSAYSQTVTSVMPPSGIRSSYFQVTITGSGTNWQSGGYGNILSVTFSGTGVTAGSAWPSNTTNMTAWVSVSNTATAGPRNVTVNFYNGSNWFYASKTNGFSVAKSTILNMNPGSANQGDMLFGVVITGTATNWQVTGYGNKWVDVSFSGTGILTDNIINVDTTTIFFDMAIAGNAATGYRDVYVEYSDGSANIRTDTLLNGLYIDLFSTISESDAEGKKFPEVYPVPSRGVITIQSGHVDQENIHCNILDISGNKVTSFDLQIPSADELQQEIDLSDLNLQNGVYLLKTESTDRVSYRKIIFLR